MFISGEQGAEKSKFKGIFLTGVDCEDGMGENLFMCGDSEDGMRVKQLSLNSLDGKH